LYRLRPQDFGEIKHVDGISPAWPLSYDDFEPWYSRAERLYQVHGNGGEDPTEGHRSEPYPWPAVSHEPRIQQISDDLAKGGFHPFHAPCGILLNEASGPGVPAQHRLELIRQVAKVRETRPGFSDCRHAKNQSFPFVAGGRIHMRADALRARCRRAVTDMAATMTDP
jgi:choline dehydrogenase-like flavoprotein